MRVKIGERWYTVQVGDLDTNPVRVLVDGEAVAVDLELVGETAALPESLPAPITSGPAPITSGPANDTPALPQGRSPGVASPAPRAPAATKVFKAPMPGVVLSVAVEKGQQVVTGDEICVLEAMKMQQSLRADWSGIVNAVHVKPGQQVLDGDPIVDLE